MKVILPLDKFVITNKAILDDKNRLVLMMLYQPIVGSIAINLYFLLWTLLEKNAYVSPLYDHYILINMLQLKLDDIEESREKLEGIGLLKTYYKKGEVNNYVYELYSPLTSYEFTSNPLLNTALFNNVGKKQYDKIIKLFKNPEFDLTDYEDISLSFKDVYSFNCSIIETNLSKIKHLDLIIEPKININEVLSLIPEEMIEYKKITKSMKDLISKLAFVYNLDNDKMSEMIINSIKNKEIVINLLKENCRNFYSFENNGGIPKIVYKNQPEYLRRDSNTTTKLDKLIYDMETISPYDFLKSKNGNVNPTKSDLLIIEYLLIDMELNPGVVNVLIDYVLKINNNKLNKNFVETIASQWKKSNINTSTDAITLARKEFDIRKNNKVYSVKEKKTPNWLNKEIDDEELSDEELEKFKKKLKGEL